MHHELLSLNDRAVRGTDSNSLLRLYDRAQAVPQQAQSQVERQKLERAIERIARELQRRNVTF
jgi:hypothetical protein